MPPEKPHDPNSSFEPGQEREAHIKELGEQHRKRMAELAELSEVEYESVRKHEAKVMGWRAGVLDRHVAAARRHEVDEDLGLFQPNPWPEPIDGDDLLDRLVKAITRYVVLPLHAAVAVALWVIHTHGYYNWRHTPRLNVTAPEPDCGKSTLLDVILPLVPRGMKSENVTTAVFFRMMDEHAPTFLVDEADTFLRDHDELRGALNAGHARGGRHLRCEGDDNKVKAFKTFGPVALAGIRALPRTLTDRSIVIQMQKKKPAETVLDFRDDRVDHLLELASQAQRWVKDNKAALTKAEPVMPDGLHNRRADNWRPLLAIADTAGGEWPERARQAAQALVKASRDDSASYSVEMLADIRKIFDETAKDAIASEDLVERLIIMEDRPWPEFGKQRKPISKNQVARLLKPFGVAPSLMRLPDKVARGYKLKQFEDLFERYLNTETEAEPADPPPQPLHRYALQETADFSQSQTVTRTNDVTVPNPPKASKSVTCNGVTVENGRCGPAHVSEANYEAEERRAIQSEPDPEEDPRPDFLKRKPTF